MDTLQQLLDSALWITLMVLFVLLVWYLISYMGIVDQRYRRPQWFLGHVFAISGPGITAPYPWPFFKRTPEIPIVPNTLVLAINTAQTLDNNPIRFDLTIKFQIDPTQVRAFLLKIGDGIEALKDLAVQIASTCSQTTNYDDIQHNSEKFAARILEMLNDQTNQFGVIISFAGIKNLDITDASLKDEMAAKARAKQRLDAYDIFAKRAEEIASKLGMTTVEFVKMDNMRLMNTDGKGGFFAFETGSGGLMGNTAAMTMIGQEIAEGSQKKEKDAPPAKG